MRHAKEMAASIISNQNVSMPKSIQVKEVVRKERKRTETIGPDTHIQVSITRPAVIIREFNTGGIEELVVISPTSNFSILIESDNYTKLEKTYAELASISGQAKDIVAFENTDGNYILNITDYKWQNDIKLSLCSTSGTFVFNQVYANWYVYGE